MQAFETFPLGGSVGLAGLHTAIQFVAIILIALVAGSTFGIWAGYDPAAYSARTFLETHQGAVRGLNLLLPLMGAGALVLTGLLAVLARRDGPALWVYLAAFALMAIAALVTRFANQPINGRIMAWSVETMPANWTQLRQAWWSWHLVRTACSAGGLTLLVLAALAFRRG